MFADDPLTHAQRLVVPGRSNRLGPRPTGCPFCPGNEEATPAETARHRLAGAPGWAARAFPNLYPLTDAHEIVVPTPEHRTSWRAVPVPELVGGLQLMLDRRAALARDGCYVHAFINDGAAAGASIPHVHAQLVSVPHGPQTQALTAGVRDAHSCSLCALLRADEGLLIERGMYHSLLAHPVPRMGGGLLIVPHEHAVVPDPDHLAELAELLHRAWHSIDPAMDANCWLVADEDALAHWYLELQPRSAYQAGLELALGIAVSANEPRLTAEHARERLAMPALS